VFDEMDAATRVYLDDIAEGIQECFNRLRDPSAATRGSTGGAPQTATTPLQGCASTMFSTAPASTLPGAGGDMGDKRATLTQAASGEIPRR
jgi:hypothetical protein